MDAVTRPESVHLATSFSVTLATITQDTPLNGYVLNNATSDVTRASCRRIRVSGAGNLAVLYPNGVTDIVPFLAGESQWIQVAKIFAAGTTVTGVSIFW